MQESYVLSDEDHRIKLQECEDLLLAAGYFKVRVKSLDIFDKIFGGMLWCLSATDANIDSSLIFMENMSIKEKIYATEHVVNILKEMKCPHNIEPHQIQGYDVFNIYPVLQWLVKITINSRKKSQKYIESAVKWNFNKYFLNKHDNQLSSINTHLISDSVVPHRVFKKSNNFSNTLLMNVTGTLREYEQDFLLYTENDTNNTSMPQQNSKSNEIELIKVDNKNETSINKNILSSSKDIMIIVDEDLKVENDKLRREKYLHSLNTQLEKLVNDYKNYNNLIKNTEIDIDKLNSSISEIENNFEQKESTIQSIKKDVNFDEPEIKEIYDNLDSYSKLKTQQVQNRSDYKSKVSELEKELSILEKTIDDKKIEKINKQYNDTKIHFDETKNRLLDLSESLSVLSKDVSKIQFDLSDTPTRSELNGFQRRLLELYTHMTLIFQETEQYFALYNGLSDIVTIQQKQNTILESIGKSFANCQQNSYKQIEFAKSLTIILDSANESYTKLKDNFNSTIKIYNEVNTRYQSLIQKQQVYNSLVSQFKKKFSK